MFLAGYGLYSLYGPNKEGAKTAFGIDFLLPEIWLKFTLAVLLKAILDDVFHAPPSLKRVIERELGMIS